MNICEACGKNEPHGCGCLGSIRLKALADRVADLEHAIRYALEKCETVEAGPRLGAALLVLRGAIRSSAPSVTLTILFVVNGEDVRVEAESDVLLSAVRNKALELSRNTGRPGADWEVRRDDGVLLDPEQTLAAQGIEIIGTALRSPLFVTLRCGVGGST